MRIFKNLEPAENRLPKDTSRIVHAKPLRHYPMNKPELMVNNHPGIQRNLSEFKRITPQQVRQEVSDSLQSMVDAANRQIAKSVKFRGIRFEADQRSGKTVVSVRDIRSGEVLKQIPSQKMLEVAGRLKDVSGLLTDISV